MTLDTMKSNSDTLNHGITVVFFNNGKFITSQRKKNKSIILGSGKYSISKDGKKMIQDGVSFLILVLNEKELILEISKSRTLKMKKII